MESATASGYCSDVLLLHLRSKGTASAYITYCTSSCNVNKIYEHLTVQYNS